MTDSRRQLLVTVLAVAALTAGVTFAANWVASSRSAAAAATILEHQSKQLDELTREVAGLRSSCAATRTAQVVVNPANAPSPAALPPERVEALAAVLADRLRPEEPESPPRDAETIAGFNDATRLFNAALAQKRWTDADVSALQAVAGRMHPDDLAELRRQVAVAINANKMSLETREIF
jgi:hypothetical protein